MNRSPFVGFFVASVGWISGMMWVSVHPAWAESPNGKQDSQLQILSDDQLTTIVGGAHCDNSPHPGGPCPHDGKKPCTEDPVDLRNGNLFYEITDFSFPTHAGRRVALRRRYDAQIFSDLENWQEEPGTGTWVAQHGVYSGHGDRSTSVKTYTDAIIELDVRTVEPGEDTNVTEQTAWINFRYTPGVNPLDPPLSRYYVLIHKDGSVELSKSVGGIRTELNRATHADIDPTQWNRVRIENIGTNIKVFINGVPIFDVTDSGLSSGHVALESYFSNAHFDNMVITDPNNSSNNTSDDFDDLTEHYYNDYPFGNQWKNSYGDRIWERSNGDVVVERSSGIRDVFTSDGLGGYDPPALSYDTLVKDTNHPTGDVYTITSKHQTVWAFDVDGKLKSITDRHGNRIELGYTSKSATVSPLTQSDLHTLLVDNFDDDGSGVPAINHNSLGLVTGDDGTLQSRTAVGGANQLQWNQSGDYFYSKLCLGTLYSDLSAYSHLRVRLKGLSGGEQLSIMLEKPGMTTGPSVVVGPLTTAFSTIDIPLSNFSGLNLSQVQAVKFLFDQQSSGTIQVDDLQFVDLVTPANGNETYWVDRLTTIKVDPGTSDERVVTLEYGTNGKVNKVIVPQPTADPNDDPSLMREYHFTSGLDGNLTESKDPENHTRKYAYTSGHNRTLETYTNRAGKVTKFFYAYNNRCIEQEDPNLNKTFFTYETGYANVFHFSYASHNDEDPTPPEPFWQYQFDVASGNLAKMVSPEVNDDDPQFPQPNVKYEESWEYYIDPTDPNYSFANRNRLKSYTDHQGHTTTYTYDANGNTQTITNDKGHTTTYQYHATFNFVTRIDEEDLANETPSITRYTIFEYDNTTGDLKKIRRAHVPSLNNEVVTTFDQYDSHGNLKKHTDPLGRITTFTYDGHGHLETRTNPETETWTYTYNEIGGVLTVKDPKNATTTYERDDRGQVVKVIPPAPFSANTTQYTYDGNRKLKTITRKGVAPGQADLVTQYEYDHVGRLAKVIDPMGHETVYLHDSKEYLHRGRTTLESVEDANDHVTTHHYDEIGRLIETIDPENSPNVTTKYTYYGDDRLKTVTAVMDPNDSSKDQVTRYHYNELNQVKTITYPDGSKHHYSYDALGNMISETTRKGDTITYVYDSLNRRTKKMYPNSDQIVYHYKDNGLLESVDDLVGPNGSGSHTYVYDNANRLTSVTDPWGRVVGYGYDANGNRNSITYPGDSSPTLIYEHDQLNRLDYIDDPAISGVQNYDFDYDEFNRRTKLTYPNAVNANYVYDDAHRLTSLTNKPSPSGPAFSSFVYNPDPVGNRDYRDTLDGRDDYTYDKINRLTQVAYADGRNVTYTLDPLGNRESVNDNGTVTNYTVNHLNQYTAVGHTGYSYDANGSLTSDGVRTFTYDVDNRLTQVVKEDYALDFDGTGTVTVPRRRVATQQRTA